VDRNQNMHVGRQRDCRTTRTERSGRRRVLHDVGLVRPNPKAGSRVIFRTNDVTDYPMYKPRGVAWVICLRKKKNDSFGK